MSRAEPQPFTMTDRHGRTVTKAKPVLEMTRGEYRAARAAVQRAAIADEIKRRDEADRAAIMARYQVREEDT